MINALFSSTAADSPTDLSAVQVNLTSISVSWTPAATVTGYQVYWSGGGGADSGSISVGAEDRTVTITELTPGLTYDITLVALSDYLPSPAATVTVTLGESSVYVARNCHGPKFSRIGHWQILCKNIYCDAMPTSGCTPYNNTPTYTCFQWKI